MTIYTPVGTTETPETPVSDALYLYETATNTLRVFLEDFCSGSDLSAREIAQQTAEHRKALLVLLQERATIAKLRKEEAGIAYDYALDFDEARDEIGRRLACIRNAGAGD